MYDELSCRSIRIQHDPVRAPAMAHDDKLSSLSESGSLLSASGLPSVFFFLHSAKKLFAERSSLPSEKKHSAKNKKHSAKSFFAECFFTLGKKKFKPHFEAVN
jgi:hypothetical protein